MTNTTRLAAAAAALLLAAACAESVQSPTALSTTDVTALAVGDRNEDYTIRPGIVNVCAFYPWLGGAPDEFTRKATMTASAPAGEDIIAGAFEIQPLPSCIEVWNATSSNTVTVSSTLQTMEAGYELERVAVGYVENGVQEFRSYYGATSGSVNVNDQSGGYIWFKFKKVEIPEVGGEGCTPGYWKQPHHFDSWTAPYTPNTQFSAVFANAFPGMTLLQVLSQGGGGIKALGRHTVAALLNSASAGVDYDYTTATVIAQFNATHASGSASNISNLHTLFAMLNEQGCPLN